jgi:hypothetical protein
MGPTALLPVRRQSCYGFHRSKNPSFSAGFQAANFGPNGKHDNHYTTENELFNRLESRLPMLWYVSAVEIYFLCKEGLPDKSPFGWYHLNQARTRTLCATTTGPGPRAILVRVQTSTSSPKCALYQLLVWICRCKRLLIIARNNSQQATHIAWDTRPNVPPARKWIRGNVHLVCHVSSSLPRQTSLIQYGRTGQDNHILLIELHFMQS